MILIGIVLLAFIIWFILGVLVTREITKEESTHLSHADSDHPRIAAVGVSTRCVHNEAPE